VATEDQLADEALAVFPDQLVVLNHTSGCLAEHGSQAVDGGLARGGSLDSHANRQQRRCDHQPDSRSEVEGET
jgi:hypothetical protein